MSKKGFRLFSSILSPLNYAFNRVGVFILQAFGTNVPRNYHPLNLRSALPDVQQLLVTVKSLNIVLFHQAVSAVKLDGVVGTTVHELRALQLAHGGFL
jgi:hypothetical protein